VCHEKDKLSKTCHGVSDTGRWAQAQSSAGFVSDLFQERSATPPEKEGFYHQKSATAASHEWGLPETKPRSDFR
jgi:hypothetical protein